jgi:hypothetical protein
MAASRVLLARGIKSKITNYAAKYSKIAKKASRGDPVVKKPLLIRYFLFLFDIC